MLSTFNYKNPDYIAVFNHRIEKLKWIRANPNKFSNLLGYYRTHPWDFISDWGCTYDPRNPEKDRPATIPFILFDKQVEWIKWVYKNWKSSTPGMTEKSREMGVTWLAMSFSSTLCLLYDGISIGFGSRVENDVDNKGDANSIFEKGRIFIECLPPEFRFGWNRYQHGAYQKINFPHSNSMIIGGSGPNMGRGGRTSIYFVDEAAHLQNAISVDKALSATTNCRQDISTPNGRANSFAIRRFSGKLPVFTMHWRDDPRKDEQWYKEKCELLVDPVVIAQELDLDYSASVEGVIIPAAWVQSAIDAHLKLKVIPRGQRILVLDISDQGIDLNVAAGRKGILVDYAKSWTGRQSNLFQTTRRIVEICDEFEIDQFFYDGDGMGAAVHGDLEVINEQREERGYPEIFGYPFRAGGAIHSPNKSEIPRVKNIDRFYNLKAQSWWELRMRFWNTHKAITEGLSYDPEEIISLDSKLDEIDVLAVELSQPVFIENTNGKLLVDKTPDGARSPNHADVVMMMFAKIKSRGMFDV